MLKATSSIVNVSQITGVLPVVNGGTGVTTSTGTGSTVLSAAPTLSGNVTLSTGNLIVASGQGIDFSATPGTGTSELLADYEEGTWTPSASSQTGLITTFVSAATYTKIGRLVLINGFVQITVPGTAGGVLFITSLPFANGNSGVSGKGQQIAILRESENTGVAYLGNLSSGTTNMVVSTTAGLGVSYTANSQYSFNLAYYTT